MDAALAAISIWRLAIAFLPTLLVLGIMYRWSADARTGVYATARMLAQLLLIGYVLGYVFRTDEATLIVAVLALMLAVASWIAIRPLAHKNAHVYLNSLAAITLGGVPTLLLVSQVVVGVDPWFAPRYVVPLAGMIFAGAMNTVSLAAERLQAELENATPALEARRLAFHASMIPMVNSFFAVGLVSLPGMMTGQILAGVSPVIAATYQIVVMSMLFGAAGVAAAAYLVLRAREFAAATS